TNPAELVERFWEAHDLILKAMTTHDGPFNWEGTHFHYRSVNVWPRPWQEPHPPVWMPVGSPGSAAEAAERGMTIGVLNTGWARDPRPAKGRDADQSAHDERRGRGRGRPLIRRHPRRRVPAAEGVLRSRRRVWPPPDDGPRRPHQPRGHRRQPDAVLAGSAA